MRVGTLGWRYRAWRGDFYPQGLVHRRELEYLAGHLDSVETNGTFYSLQRPTSFAAWRDATPPDFVFAVKGGRFVTHLKRLRDPEQGLANFFASGVLSLEDRLGPVLWQLPSSLGFDEEVLEHFCSALPRTTADAAALAARHTLADDRVALPAGSDRPLRHALEPRHLGFAEPSAVALLSRHDMATVWSDNPGRWPVIEQDTASWRYVRLHGHTDLYTSAYSGMSLTTWAQRCLAWSEAGQDVVVYFDNDARGHAPHDAVALRARLTDAVAPP